MEKNLELLEQFPTGWIVVDTINASLFNDDEIKLIIEFNENKGRRVRMAEWLKPLDIPKTVV